ncbi:MAG: response regulator transcription factor [Chitinophagaceae bacterium]
MISIVIIDDHLMVRQSWEIVLNRMEGFWVNGHTDNMTEALQLIRDTKPSVVLLDINMRPVSGFRIAREILSQNPAEKIIGVSATSYPAYAKKLLNLGGRGYVSKNSPGNELELAIREIAAGRTFLSTDIREQLEDLEKRTDKPEDLFNLSAREMEIVKDVCDGLSSKQIAVHLGITLKTVEVHRNHILKKLGLRNVAGLIRYMGEQEV